MVMENSLKKVVDGENDKPASCLKNRSNIGPGIGKKNHVDGTESAPKRKSISWNKNDRTFRSSGTSTRVTEEVHFVATEESFVGSLDPKVVRDIERAYSDDQAHFEHTIGSLDPGATGGVGVRSDCEDAACDDSGDFDYFDDDANDNARNDAMRMMGLGFEKTSLEEMLADCDKIPGDQAHSKQDTHETKEPAMLKMLRK